MSVIGTYYALRVVRLLTQDWKDMDLYELGIVDEKGKVLKKFSKLKTIKEREAYDIFTRLVLHLRRMLEKVPGAKNLITYMAIMRTIREFVEEETTEEDARETMILIYKELEERGYEFPKEEMVENIMMSYGNKLVSKIQKEQDILDFLDDVDEMFAGGMGISGVGTDDPTGHPAAVTAIKNRKRKKYKKDKTPLVRRQS